MSQRKIIFIFILLFIASSFWLFYQSDKQSNPNSGKAWWSLYFTNPKGNSLNFTIENHSDKTDFHWEVFADQDKILEASMEASKGTTKDVDLSNIKTDDFKNKKISVKVSADDEVEEIYKNF